MSAPAPRRRRIYLMRHGAVENFAAGGRRIPTGERHLSASGRAQADAAGRFFQQHGVRFDRAIASDLPRTVETAERVLAAMGRQLTIERWPELREIAAGSLAELDDAAIEAEYSAAFKGMPAPEDRYMRGESYGELLARVGPALERIAAARDWDCLLLALHGGTNRAVLSHALTGGRQFLGNFQQSPGCIDVLDVGEAHGDWVLRAVNIAPTDPAHAATRTTTMEEQYAAWRARRDAITPKS